MNNNTKRGVRRGLWGHSFRSSYSLELIFDFWENQFWGCSRLYSDTWYLVSSIWYLVRLWIPGYLDIWISGFW